MIEELAEALATYQRANAVLLETTEDQVQVVKQSKTKTNTKTKAKTTEDQVVEEQSKTELFINTTLHDKP